jgi:hypothetical protein
VAVAVFQRGPEIKGGGASVSPGRNHDNVKGRTTTGGLGAELQRKIISGR